MNGDAAGAVTGALAGAVASSKPGALPRQRGTVRGAGGGTHRRDIQALRALAVGMVIVYHLWHEPLSGGFVSIDIFFVVSGFLITTQLMLSRLSCGRDLVLFWMRRIRRLLPAALLVLAATLLLSALIAPPGQRKGTAAEIAASALNVQNWWLADRSVDYLATGVPSPVQHYWSLSVEEQFYLGWPVLVLGCVLLTRRRPERLGALALGVFSVVVVTFLVQTIRITAADPAGAYFVTTTRVWELAAGAALAAGTLVRSARRGAGGTRTDPPRARIRCAVALVGFGLIAFSALWFSAADAWPGWRVTIPVLGTLLIIAAHAPDSSGLLRVLSLRPIQWLGNASYSVYLWHWPLIVLLPAWTGRQLTFTDKILVLAAGLLLGGLTKRHFEDRFRRHPVGASIGRPFLVAGVAIAVVLAGTGAQVVQVARAENAARAELSAVLSDDDPCLGAGARRSPAACAATNRSRIVPAPVLAVRDLSDAWRDGCLAPAPYRGLPTCSYGPATATRRIALVGNSFAAQWLPAVQQIAQRRGWQVTTFLAERCAVSAQEFREPNAARREACLAWGSRVMAATSTGDFDLVVVSQLSGARRGTDDAASAAVQLRWREGYREYLAEWRSAGVPVVVLRATPVAASTVPLVADCVAVNPARLERCAGAARDWVGSDPLAEAAAGLPGPLVRVADFTDRFCDETCAAVIGGVLVYQDSIHMTATFARTLAPDLDPYLGGPREWSRSAHP